MKGTLFATIFSAVGASLCCSGPALMLVFGSTTLGIFSLFEHIRPFATVLAIGLLGFAFYRSYRKDRDDSCCEIDKEEVMKRNKIQRRVLFGITPLVLALLLFPYYSGFLYAGDGKDEEKVGVKSEWVIEGMTCEGCARGLQGSMEAVKGVKSCNVDYETKIMICTTDQKVLKSDDIPGLVERTGYKAVQKDRKPKDGKSAAMFPTGEKDRHGNVSFRRIA